jgi:hypothetical protein
MARPEKIIEDKRTQTARVRLTAAEATKLNAAAEEEGLTLSDFIRNKALNAKPRRRPLDPDRKVLISSLGSLGHIRADINQMLKDRWAYKFVDAARVDSAFTSIEAIADKIHNTLSNDN